MAAGGRDKVTLALLSMPQISVRAILSALPAVMMEQTRETAYKMYVAEALRIITENTGKYAGGSYMKQRYIDIIDPKPEEKRTGSEIIDMLKNKLAEIGGEPD